MSSNYTVYQHRNKINNKSYIGITNKPIKQRWKNGFGYLNQDFYNAIQKYGWDNFEHIILKQFLSEEEAKKLEQYYIEYFDSYNNGYNRSRGGESGFSGGHHSEESKQNISQHLKDYIEQNDPNRGIRLREMLQNNPEIEEKRKINANKTRPKAGTQEAKDKCKKNCKKVLCIETNQIFDSVKDAGNWAKISNTGITHCCKGDQKTAGGYHWKYIEDC